MGSHFLPMKYMIWCLAFWSSVLYLPQIYIWFVHAFRCLVEACSLSLPSRYYFVRLIQRMLDIMMIFCCRELLMIWSRSLSIIAYLLFHLVISQIYLTRNCLSILHVDIYLRNPSLTFYFVTYKYFYYQLLINLQ